MNPYFHITRYSTRYWEVHFDRGIGWAMLEISLGRFDINIGYTKTFKPPMFDYEDMSDIL